jgi:hypothetical protein
MVYGKEREREKEREKTKISDSIPSNKSLKSLPFDALSHGTKSLPHHCRSSQRIRPFQPTDVRLEAISSAAAGNLQCCGAREPAAVAGKKKIAATWREASKPHPVPEKCVREVAAELLGSHEKND